jgi:lysozyme family protein
MAAFDPILEKTILREGGFVLHQVPGDRGGETYAGIARRRHSDWSGWELIDEGRTGGIKKLVAAFYHQRFWRPIHGHAIDDQQIAAAVFDFAVNAGPTTAIRAAQRVAGVGVDGLMGPITLAALNASEPESFLVAYALARVRYYAGICNMDRSQSKFLLGWINRALAMIA